MMGRRGLGVVLSSPSGVGKSTLAGLLIAQDQNLSLSISVTTRSARPREIDGVHYRFITAAQFAEMRDRNELLEWAEVHGNKYGSPRKPAADNIAAGRDTLFDVDWQGARQISSTMSEDVVRIFLLPPSMAELGARLQRRAEDSQQTIASRLANAYEEITHWHEYDYVIVNETLEISLYKLQTIIAVERMHRRRHPEIGKFVRSLLSRS